MVDKQRIHAFAIKYHTLYVNPQTEEKDVFDAFADQCFAFGFEMDCGKRFKGTYSSAAFNNNDALDRIIESVDDIELLGSAIFSHWRYVTHWSYNEHLLDDAHRQWFITAFERLAVITGEPDMYPFIFEGELEKLQLISNTICCGPYPEPDKEVEQHLTITSDGRVWLSRYAFGDPGMEHTLIERKHFSVSKDAVMKIMDAVSEYFSNEYDIDFVTDVGSWNLTLTNTDGRQYKITGPLYLDLQTAQGGLSDIIRSQLKRNDLYLFDGNPDAISKIDIHYHRHTKIMPGVKPEGVTWEYVTWDYNERLTLNRESETIEHFREIGSGCTVKKIYYVEEGVSSFLDDMGIDAFSEVIGNPADVINNPLERKDYTITIETKHGIVRKINGTYDKNGLPSDWPDFMDNLFEFITSYGIGELFDPHVYGKAKRRQSDYIFCNVTFEEGGRTYYYIADNDIFEEGDWVVVPAGQDNHEAIVRIESIEYHPAEEAPFPIEKTKHILRKHEEDEDDSKD